MDKTVLAGEKPERQREVSCAPTSSFGAYLGSGASCLLSEISLKRSRFDLISSSRAWSSLAASMKVFSARRSSSKLSLATFMTLSQC